MQEKCGNIPQGLFSSAEKIFHILRTRAIGIDIFSLREYGTANNFKRPA